MLTLEGVTVRFDDSAAVENVSLQVSDDEQLSILGPSGSGKSTLLRAIAGLEPLSAGRIAWDGADLANVPIHRRGFGLMFQDYVLFPHMDVARNVRFGLEASGVGGVDAVRRASEVLEMVGLGAYGRRMPVELSGGEQQRVALARALAPKPRLLMLDEPLGALDRSLRRNLLDELAATFADLQLPIIYVTHDHEEALAVGDRVAVMNAGRLEAIAPPAQLWASPPNEFVARFLGLTNIVTVRVVDGVAASAIGTFAAPTVSDGEYRVLIRPSAFRPSVDGEIVAVVAAATFRGDYVSLVATTREGVVLEIHAGWRPAPAVGERLRLAVDPARVSLLGDAGSSSRAYS